MRRFAAFLLAALAVVTFLGSWALAGFDVSSFPALLDKPVAWGLMSLALLALVVLLGVDVRARINRSGVDMTVDSPPREKSKEEENGSS